MYGDPEGLSAAVACARVSACRAVAVQIGQNLRQSGINLRQRNVIQIDILPDQIAAIVVFAIEQPVQAVDVMGRVAARDFLRPAVLGIIGISADRAAGYFRLLHLPGGVPHITLRTDRRDIPCRIVSVAGPADRGDLVLGTVVLVVLPDTLVRRLLVAS